MIYYYRKHELTAVFLEDTIRKKWDNRDEEWDTMHDLEWELNEKFSVTDKSYDNETDCVVIPDHIKFVDCNAFRFIPEIKTIQLSKAFADRGSFQKCEHLERVIIPKGCSVPENAFWGCKNLKMLEVEEGAVVDKKAFPDSVGLEFVMNGIRYQVKEDGVFEDCEKFGDLVLKEGRNRIDRRNYYQCTSLTGIVIPDGVWEIDAEAFRGCVNLKKVQLPDSLEYVERGAFWNCSELEHIAIPKSVKRIAEDAFSGCTKLEKSDVMERLRREKEAASVPPVSQKPKKKSLLEKLLPVVYYAKNSTIPEEE